MGVRVLLPRSEQNRPAVGGAPRVERVFCGVAGRVRKTVPRLVCLGLQRYPVAIVVAVKGLETCHVNGESKLAVASRQTAKGL